MSHFNKIKTKIKDHKILKRSLGDLKIKWQSLGEYQPIRMQISLSNKTNNRLIELHWRNHCYELITELNEWQEKNEVDYLLEKIYQKYASNLILEESKIQGFKDTNTSLMSDGSMRITLERWQ